MKTDSEKYVEYRDELLCGAGMSLSVRKVISMLDVLMTAYGSDFRLDDACEALDSMIDWANIVKTALKIKNK